MRSQWSICFYCVLSALCLDVGKNGVEPTSIVVLLIQLDIIIKCCHFLGELGVSSEGGCASGA